MRFMTTKTKRRALAVALGTGLMVPTWLLFNRDGDKPDAGAVVIDRPASDSSRPIRLSDSALAKASPGPVETAPVPSTTPERDLQARRLLTDTNLYATITGIYAQGTGAAHDEIIQILLWCDDLNAKAQRGEPVAPSASLARSADAARAAETMLSRCASLPPNAYEFFSRETHSSNRNSPATQVIRKGAFKDSDLRALLSVYAPNGVTAAFRDFAVQAGERTGMPGDQIIKTMDATGVATRIALCQIGYDLCDSPDDIRVLARCYRLGECHASYLALLQADFDKRMPLPDPSLAAHRREVQAAMVDKIRQQLLRHG